MNKSNRKTILGIIILIIATLMLSIGLASKIQKEQKDYEEAVFQLQEIDCNLDEIQQQPKTIKQNNTATIEEFVDTLGEQHENLDVVQQKLSSVEEPLDVLEDLPEEEMRPLYEEIKNELQEVEEILDNIDMNVITEDSQQISDSVVEKYDDTQAELEESKDMLDNLDNERLDKSIAYEKYEEAKSDLTSAYDKTQSDLQNMGEQVVNIQTKYDAVITKFSEFNQRATKYLNIIEKYESDKAMKLSLYTKLEAMGEISSDMDMLEPIGFTEAEIKYLLEQAAFIKDADIIRVLARLIVEERTEHPLNEVFAIAVLSIDTDNFTSEYAVDKYNYVRINKNEDTKIFQSIEDGLRDLLDKLYDNCVNQSGNIYRINTIPQYSYPSDLDLDGKIEGVQELWNWSYNVLELMRTCKSSITQPEDYVPEKYDINATKNNLEESNLDKEDILDEDNTLEKEKEVYYPYNQETINFLAAAMYSEEGILLSRQTYEDAKLAHILCGSVILNRARLGIGGTTIEGVLNSSGYPNSTRYMINLYKGTKQIPEEVYEWAEELLKNGPIGPNGLILQAQFFQGNEEYVRVDNQYFCLSNRYK